MLKANGSPSDALGKRSLAESMEGMEVEQVAVPSSSDIVNDTKEPSSILCKLSFPGSRRAWGQEVEVERKYT